MTPHLHREFVPGCYRCDLNLDELGIEGEHRWQRGLILNGHPTMDCANCGLVWWPDQNKPRSVCPGTKS